MADPNAPGRQRPTVLQSGNGVPLVNIQTPSAAGVSRNTYRRFDIDGRGAILNNSRTDVATQLGGWVQGNPWLATGPARVILNEVDSSDPSYLSGPLEVAGPRAEVVIANPSGIRVSGGSFINAAGVTLTTGTPVMNNGGDLESFRVRQGSVVVEGLGLDTRTADATRILARAIEVNAGLWAQDLTLVGGASEVQALASGAQAAADPIAGSGAQPAFLLDVAALGGLYAGHIYLVGTEAGLGVNNRGVLSARQGDLVLRADGRLVNTGRIQAQDGVAIQTSGAVSNNGTGAVIASQGDMTIAAGGALDNTGGTIATDGAMRVAAAGLYNAGGTVQARGDIELVAPVIDNTGGRIAAEGSVAITVAASLDNTRGSVAAGRGLTVQDAAAARTLAVKNTGGALQAGTNAVLKAARLTGDGAVTATGDLLLDLQGDLENTGLIASGGNASLRSSGRFTNRATFSAAGALSVAAADIDNAATGEISGGTTSLAAAGAVTNRGLIDGQDTRIAATTLANLGTGRLYGDRVTLEAGVLVNDTETVGGVRTDAVIAARERLDITATTVHNREGALIWSSGDIALQADALHNASATVEALGDLAITAREVTNTNEHFSTRPGPAQTEERHEVMLGPLGEKAPYDAVFFYPQRRGWFYIGATLASAEPRADGETIYANMGDCWCLVPGHFTATWNEYQYVRSTVTDAVATSAPAELRAGRNLGVQLAAGGSFTNDKSRVIAGGDLGVAGGSVNNIGALGTQTVTDLGATRMHTFRIGEEHGLDWWLDWAPYTPAPVVTTVALPVTAFQGHAGAGGSGMPAPARAAGATPQAPLALPTSGLFRPSPEPAAHYLLETDPRLTDHRQWLSSDALLQALSYDPATVQKRLGDGYYEQRLVREQVAQLTGRRFLEGYADDEAEYQALMAAGATYAQAWQLVPGVALTAEQMARLTSDIVWLVATEVTLPDGRTTTALVPRVYLRPRAGDLQPDGALLAGQNVRLNLAGDLTNSGTLAGRAVVRIDARNVQNLAGRIDAARLGVRAAEDVDNRGGTLSARDALEVDAGRDLNIATTTQGGQRASGIARYSSQGIDRVAGLYVTGQGGQLLAQAGRDLNVVAGVLASNGSLGAQAGRDLHLGTVQAGASEEVVWSAVNHRRDAIETDVGSQLQAAGAIHLQAGHDIDASAARIDAGGALDVAADHDVRIASGRQTVDKEVASQSSRRNTFSRTTLTQADGSSVGTAVASSLGGDTVRVTAGHDLGVSGSHVVSDHATTLQAGHDVSLTAATDTIQSHHFSESTRRGAFSSGGLSLTIGTQQRTDTRDTQASTAAASTVGSIGGDVTISAGQTYRQSGSDVLAPGGNVDISAGNVEITEARERGSTTTEQRFNQSGVTLAVTSPLIGTAQTLQGLAHAAGNTGDGRMQALAVAAGALTLANNARDLGNAASALASGNPAGAASLTVSVGSSRASSTTVQTSDTARASQVAAGGDVDIRATGAAGDLLVHGSDIRAGRDARLQAQGRIDLQAAQNTASLAGNSSSSSASLGVSAGAQTGVTLTGSLGRGTEGGSDVEQRNTHVTAGRSVTLQSAGDTALTGATVSADAVRADVGGDLAIQSLQDTSTYASRRQSAGGSVTFGAGSASLSANLSRVDSDYAAVQERSGIQAGDGGFQVEVAGDTRLTGGVIASTDTAVTEGRNRFTTSGTLTTTDIHNHAAYSASAAGVAVGIGTTGKEQGISGVGAGIGHDAGSASSTTTAGVSGIAGDTRVRSTDAQTRLARIFDKDRVQKKIDAQVFITQTFGREASKAWGDYANKKLATAVEAGDEQEARCWGASGACRATGHAAVGALGGGIEGALGATASALTAPAFHGVLLERASGKTSPPA